MVRHDARPRAAMRHSFDAAATCDAVQPVRRERHYVMCRIMPCCDVRLLGGKLTARKQLTRCFSDKRRGTRTSGSESIGMHSNSFRCRSLSLPISSHASIPESRVREVLVPVRPSPWRSFGGKVPSMAALWQAARVFLG